MNVPQLVMGLGSLIAGVTTLSGALRGDRHRPISGHGGRPLASGELRARIKTVRNIDERLAGVIEMMRKSIRDPRTRMIASQIVSSRCNSPNDRTGDGGWCIREKDYLAEVKAVFNWMRANVRYVRDIHSIDTFATAARTIEARAGDCDDYTITMGALLMALGFPVRTKTIRTTDSSDWNHIYLQVGLPPGKPTKWMSLDASVPRPAGWEAPAASIAQYRLDYPDDPKWGR
jgi:predicted transglutaminase-like cysteine proteinase